MFEYLGGNTPKRALEKMEDPDFADLRREGINDFMRQGEFARKPPYTTRYGEIALKDPDYTVRATAIRALNQCRDQASTRIFIQALSDPSDMVRLEAAKALNRVPDTEAIDPLKKVILSPTEQKDVRIAATEALSHYRTLDTARSLITLLGEKDFSLVWQARKSLTAMLKIDFGYDDGEWLSYVTRDAKL
jgi:hypothetical protein